MANIPNTEYITVNANGIFVGGKPATTYRGEKILFPDDVLKYFADIQKLNKNVAELHVLSSETSGEYAKVGNPSGNHGRNEWCRVKFNDGRVASWVFRYTNGSAADCANFCAYYCASHVRGNAAFRAAVFGAVIEKQKRLAPKQKEVKMYKKTENYPIQNTVVLSDKNGNYHVAFDSKIGHEEFSGTRAEVLQQMTLRVKRLLNVR